LGRLHANAALDRHGTRLATGNITKSNGRNTGAFIPSVRAWPFADVE
jgi:hypothetical protein